MTILTGDFTYESKVGGHSSEQRHASDANGTASMPEDAQYYLRHVENGESIRSIAREAGCHASTILRRIRRFEASRDDPLIDSAIEHRKDEVTLHSPEAMRTLRRLAEPGAVMVVAAGMDRAIVTRDDIRTGILQRRLAEEMALNGWVAQIGNGRVVRYAISPAGREVLRQRVSAGKAQRKPRAAMPQPKDFQNAQAIKAGDTEKPDLGPKAAQRHRVWSERHIQDPESGKRRRARVNIAESPLLMLARRRDGNGQPFLTPAMVAAGERLREDYELAQLGPRVTQNWSGFMTAGIDVSHAGTGYRGGSESARNRVAVALRELGPGMGDIVLRVCCFLEGIEMTERRLGWSARSGKIVLRLALMRLERHYAETYGKGSPLIG